MKCLQDVFEKLSFYFSHKASSMKEKKKEASMYYFPYTQLNYNPVWGNNNMFYNIQLEYLWINTVWTTSGRRSLFNTV